jgi:hypothetical protein
MTTPNRAIAALLALTWCGTSAAQSVPAIQFLNTVPTCEASELGLPAGTQMITWDSPFSGNVLVTGFGTINRIPNGNYVSWTSDFNIDAVIVPRNGSTTIISNGYRYDPGVMGDVAPPGLQNNGAGDPHVYHHLYFCVAPPPPGGTCTLTQGYWKTHSDAGPAPYDDTWNLLPGGDGVPGSGNDGSSTPFFTTGQTWLEIFNAPPRGGNAYLQLAHQWMAATLNELSGADVPPAVAAALAAGETLLADNAANWNNPSAFSNATRNAMRAAAGTLGSYNEGDIGPGHCTDPLPPTSFNAGTTTSTVFASPNPFSASTAVTFTLEQNAQVSVVVYDLLGRPVATLVDAAMEAGNHDVRWDAAGLPSGTYMVVMRTGTTVQTQAITLTR